MGVWLGMGVAVLVRSGVAVGAGVLVGAVVGVRVGVIKAYWVASSGRIDQRRRSESGSWGSVLIILQGFLGGFFNISCTDRDTVCLGILADEQIMHHIIDDL